METNTDIREYSIAVVAMQGRFPDAENISQFWENLREGRDSIKPVDMDEIRKNMPEDVYSKENFVPYASYIDGSTLFDNSFFEVSDREAVLMDPQHRIFLELCNHAMEEMGYVSGKTDRIMGVFAGNAFNTYLTERLLKFDVSKDSTDRFLLQIMNDKDNLATKVSYKLNLKGPAMNIQTACSTSLTAVHYACQSLLNYECDCALAGAVTVRFPEKSGYLHETGMILSEDGHCHPFAEDSSGTVFGSGAGVIGLKRLSDAIEDKDRIYAVIRGSAVNNDGNDKAGYTAPSSTGQKSVIEQAIINAEVSKDDISYIETHGTATAIGDSIELKALKEVFEGNVSHPVAIGSVKSNIGHLENASGMASLIKCILCMQNHELVPTVGFSKPNPLLDIDNSVFYVNAERREWQTKDNEPLYCGISSFGIGGTNVHMILVSAERYNIRSHTVPDSGYKVFPVSARSEKALVKKIADLESFINTSSAECENISAALCYGRRDLEYRTAFTAIGKHELLADIMKFSSSDIKRSEPELKTAFLFAGQGAQYVGMARELYENNEEYRSIADRGFEIYRNISGTDLRDILYSDDGSQDERAVKLMNTELTQTALFITEYTLAKCLENKGITADVTAGHSIGEYVSACLAEVFTYEDGVKIVAARGRCMENSAEGSMLSVSANREEVQRICGNVRISLYNSDNYVTLGGNETEIADCESKLAEHGIQYRRIKVSHAYHTDYMKSASEEFGEILKKYELHKPQRPFYSNVTGRMITSDEAVSVEYWKKQMISPVRFSDIIKDISESGKFIYAEIGTENILSHFVKDINKDAEIISLLPHPKNKISSEKKFILALGAFWSFGLYNEYIRINDKCADVPKAEIPLYPYIRKRFEPDDAEKCAAGRKELVYNAEENNDIRNNIKYNTELEKNTACIFGDVLGRKNITPEQNFFELGGNSLLAVKLLNMVYDTFGIRLTMKELSGDFTPKGLALLLNDRISSQEKKQPLMSIDGIEYHNDEEHRYDNFPLTEMQQAQYMGRIAGIRGGNTAAHVYFETEQTGLDAERINASWQEMIDTHEMLRAVILKSGEQKILKKEECRYKIKINDLRGYSEEESVKEYEKTRREMDHLIRPLEQWPMFEVRMSLLPENRIRIHFSIDLIICDVSSMRILQRDWAFAYNGRDCRKYDISFRDYVLMVQKLRETSIYDEADKNWDERIKTLPEILPPMLPYVRAASEISDIRFVRRSFRIDCERWDKIKAISVKYSISPSVAVMCAFSTVIGRYSKNKDFCINTPIINRVAAVDGVEDLIGEFSSFAPVEINAGTGRTFAENALEIQKRNWFNVENRFVSGTSILRKISKERGMSNEALLPIVFTSTIVQSVDDEQVFFDTFGEYSYLISQTPQVYLDHTLVEDKNGILVSWHTIDEMFADGIPDRMFGLYEKILNMLAVPEMWNECFDDILPDGETEIIEKANDTTADIPINYLHEGFIVNAERFPDKTAVASLDRIWTYSDILKAANHTAYELCRNSFKKGDIAILSMHKGVEQIIGALAVLMAGGAYLPTADDIPRERLDFIRNQSGSGFILVQECNYETINTFYGKDSTIITVSADKRTEEFDFNVSDDYDSPAYIIYTSGSTGNPKGVIMTHRQAVNTINDINNRFGITDKDSCFAISEMTFDLSVYDVFGILSAGGTIVLPEHGISRDPDAWIRLMKKHKATVWNSVPALMSMLVEYVGNKEFTQMPDKILLSGDWIPLDLPEKIWAMNRSAVIYSLGGATEAAIWSIYHQILPNEKYTRSIPYGKPLANQRFYVLDETMHECPIGKEGELFIGGTGVSTGYINAPELNKKSFIEYKGERVYKTGDLGRRMSDGNIEFCGRNDFQVKISGFRVEIGEIKKYLSDIPAIEWNEVIAAGKEQKRLIAFIHTRSGETLDTDVIMEQLSQNLPSYMIPKEYVFIDDIPLSANGKIDIKKLHQLYENSRKQTASTVREKKDTGEIGRITDILLDIFSEVLNLEKEDIDIHENFYSLGGDSIMGIQIITKAEKYDLFITPEMFFNNSTVAELADCLEGSMKDQKTYPLTAYHKYMLYNKTDRSDNFCICKQFDTVRVYEPEKFEQAYKAVLDKAEWLRCIFVKDEDEEWLQICCPTSEYELDYMDITGMSGESINKAVEKIVSEITPDKDHAAQKMYLCLLDDRNDHKQKLLFIANRLVISCEGLKEFIKAVDEYYISG